jgi:ureidoglycolate lyase
LPDGSADLSGLKSFLLPGTVGVIYARGVWHASASVLDRAGAFAVLMWRGANDDDVFADIAPTLLISQGPSA